jgi:hypothetical protein
MRAPSPYTIAGPPLVERSYAALPVMPGTKAPGHIKRGEWRLMYDWREEYTKRLPSRFELEIWSTYLAAGVCVVCGGLSHLVGVDVDSDDAGITAAIIGVIPRSTVIKKGAKGSTRFYRAPSIEKSKSWDLTDADGQKYRVCDLIGPGRQTVLPPTIHPDTGRPYVLGSG